MGESGWYGGCWLSENASRGLASDSDPQTKDTWGDISDKWGASWPEHGDHRLLIHSHGSQPRMQSNGWLWQQQMRICLMKVNVNMKKNIIPSPLACWLESTDWQRTARVCISLVQARVKSLKASYSQWNLNRRRLTWYLANSQDNHPAVLGSDHGRGYSLRSHNIRHGPRDLDSGLGRTRDNFRLDDGWCWDTCEAGNRGDTWCDKVRVVTNTGV